jgi:hypothetical protein
MLFCPDTDWPIGRMGEFLDKRTIHESIAKNLSPSMWMV